MSRSRKKTKIFPIGSDSMGWWKRMANKRLRRVPITDELTPDKRINNIWGSPCDGKRYWKSAEEKDMRK